MTVKIIEDLKSYSVRKDGEWATICIRQTKNDYNGGELLIHSSFGSWGNFWGNIGSRDFREFLSKLNYGYFWGKLDEDLGETFDCDGTIKELKRCILQDRKSDVICEEEAREHYEEILSFEKWHSPHKNGDLLYSCMSEYYTDLYVYLSNNDLPIVTKNKPSCEGFWKTIWSEFVVQMQEELKAMEMNDLCPVV